MGEAFLRLKTAHAELTLLRELVERE
jgi:hypothetical protein